MRYKTMVLELLKQHPTLYNRLRTQRMLMPALERYARELKTNHEGWKDTLLEVTPGRDQSQIASEALEIALRELEASLISELPPDDTVKAYVEAILMLVRAQAHHI